MSSIPSLGSRPLPSLSPLLSGAYPQTDNRSASASSTALPSQARPAASLDGSPTSLSSSGIDLQQRVGSVGNATMDLAQSLLGSFAEKLFGSSGKGATIDFNSAALDSSSSYSAAALHTEGPDGSTDAAAFQLTDSSHFLGKGTITTADGRKFDFEVEIQYDAELDVGVSQSTSRLPASGASDATAADGTDGTGSGDSSGSDGGGGGASSSGLKAVQFPNIDFAGTLADLFKLIGHNLQSALTSNDGSSNSSDNNSGDSNSIDRNTLRNLSVRLLNLVDSKPADTYAAPTAQDSADQRAKALASAYGTPATPAATDAAPASDTATPSVAPSLAASLAL
jgi:hypothetical protein